MLTMGPVWGEQLPGVGRWWPKGRRKANKMHFKEMDIADRKWFRSENEEKRISTLHQLKIILPHINRNLSLLSHSFISMK